MKNKDKLAPFEALGFQVEKYSVDNAIGQCLFCSEEEKLSVNTETGLWQCFVCGKSGNVFSFIEEWYKKEKELFKKDEDSKDMLEALAIERGVSSDFLRRYGLVFSFSRKDWVIPIRNTKGTYVSLQFYKKERTPSIISLSGMNVALGNVKGYDVTKDDFPIYLTECFWDCAALCTQGYDIDGHVFFTSGANTFKDGWERLFHNRILIVMYDNDEAGKKGVSKVLSKNRTTTKEVRSIKWPTKYPKGYDVRDFFNEEGNTRDKLDELIISHNTKELKGVNVNSNLDNDLSELSTDVSLRPDFEEVLQEFNKKYSMTSELIMALKIYIAAIYSNNLPGDPLWIHLVGPPGSGKTMILTSAQNSQQVSIHSSVSSKGLVSGFNSGGGDPSIISKILGKTFVLKDFTEILNLRQNEKEAIFGILRGAYDGRVYREFANNVKREYLGYFSMVTGVTSAIFTIKEDTFGERFLIFHLMKGHSHDSYDMLKAAMESTDLLEDTNELIYKKVAEFVDFKVQPTESPRVPDNIKEKMIYLCQITADLRASVTRDKFTKVQSFRGGPEIATRLLKQLKRLLVCLGMIRYPFCCLEEDYEIIVRVALDSCIGYNLDIVRYLYFNPNKTMTTMSELLHIQKAACRAALDDLLEYNIVQRFKKTTEEGTDVVYSLSKSTIEKWEKAGLNNKELVHSSVPYYMAR